MKRIALVDNVTPDNFERYVAIGVDRACSGGGVDKSVGIIIAHPATCGQREPHLVNGRIVIPTYGVLPDELAVTFIESWIDYFVFQRKRNYYNSFYMVEPDPDEDRDAYAVTCHILNDDEREVFPELKDARCVRIFPGADGKWNGEIEFNG